MFKPKGWLDRLFAVGIIGKGIDGILELIGGLGLLVVSPDRLYRAAVRIAGAVLDQDSDNVLATHLLTSAAGVTGSAVTFGAIYLLAHGLIKIVLVIALLKNKIWAYPWAIGVLVAFIGYQFYRIAIAPGIGLIGLTLLDAVIVALTVREYRVQRRSRAEPASVDGDDQDPVLDRREPAGSGGRRG